MERQVRAHCAYDIVKSREGQILALRDDLQRSEEFRIFMAVRRKECFRENDASTYTCSALFCTISNTRLDIAANAHPVRKPVVCRCLLLQGARVGCQVCGAAGELCPPGGYCLAGAISVTPCSAGYYNPRSGAASSAACLKCPLGQYCDGSVPGITGPCQEGYYCEEGSATDQSIPAPEGSFAPTGSGSPLLCYPGTFQDATSSADCLPCPAGKYCQTLVSRN